MGAAFTIAQFLLLVLALASMWLGWPLIETLGLLTLSLLYAVLAKAEMIFVQTKKPRLPEWPRHDGKAR